MGFLETQTLAAQAKQEQKLKAAEMANKAGKWDAQEGLAQKLAEDKAYADDMSRVAYEAYKYGGMDNELRRSFDKAPSMQVVGGR